MKFSHITIMSNNVSTSVSSNNITTVFAGFLGAFIVGSLGVQLVRTQRPSFQSQPLKVQPVIALSLIHI